MHDLGHHCIAETAPNTAQLTVDLMEVDLTDLVHHVLVVEGDKPEAAVSVSDLNIDNEDAVLSSGHWSSTLSYASMDSLTLENCSKYALTSSRLVVAESPPTKIFLVLITSLGLVLRGTATCDNIRK